MDTQHHVAAAVEEVLVNGTILAGTHFLEIVAGAKGLAIPRKDDYAQRFVHGNLIQLSLQAR